MIKREKTRKNGDSLRSPPAGGGGVCGSRGGSTPHPPIGDACYTLIFICFCRSILLTDQQSKENHKSGLLNRSFTLSVTAGVGNDFIPGGVQGVDLVLELRGVSGDGFLDPKIDQF